MVLIHKNDHKYKGNNITIIKIRVQSSEHLYDCSFSFLEHPQIEVRQCEKQQSNGSYTCYINPEPHGGCLIANISQELSAIHTVREGAVVIVHTCSGHYFLFCLASNCYQSST